MQSAAGLTHDRVGTSDRVQEDAVELLAWSLESLPRTVAVGAKRIEAAWTRPGDPCSRVTNEPCCGDGVGHAKLGEERFDTRRQRLPRTVPRKLLALKLNNAQALPDAPERGGRTRWFAS